MTSLSPDLIRQRRARDKRIRRLLRDHPEYTVRRGDTCPQCGYGVVIDGPVTDTEPIDLCMSCSAMWERELRAHPELECCSKCAFLPGSEEQKKPEEWKTIVANTVRNHGMFLCHKRVPFDLREDGTYEYKHRDETGQLLYGTRCHGWAKARCTVLVRELAAAQRESDAELAP